MKAWRKQQAPEAPLPYIGYIRVSTEDQASSGLSLEAQEAKIRGQAAAKGLTLGEIISDAGISAKTLDRPGIQRVFRMLEDREAAGVIIAKLDRITRSVPDLGRILDIFEDSGSHLVSCDGLADTSTAGARMITYLVATIAQWEREVICERTHEALQAKIRRGEHCGRIRYGYRGEGGREVPEPSEQAVLARMKELRDSGAKLREIAEALNAEGSKTRGGTPWRIKYVADFLAKMEKRAA